ncbi:hypothetical protein J7J95_01805 [bacterium]|nr:hypothetical protein [bacterium]
MMGKTAKLLFWQLLIIFFCLAKPVFGLMTPVLEIKSEQEEKRPVLARDTWRQSFVAPVDKFGAVGIKVTNNNRLNDDFWIFRIKEADQDSWYFETRKYITDFRDGFYYPFGFPSVDHALGKKFIFEIESDKGREKNFASVFFSRKDVYLDGEAYLNGHKTGGDLVFAVYQEKPAEQLIKTDFLSRVHQDSCFFAFYFGSILTLFFLLVFLILK